MNTITSRIAFIAALPGELRPLVRGWERAGTESVMYRTVASSATGDVEMLAVCCGIGREQAARACMLAVEGNKPSAIVSIGWAGALSCGMKAGQAYTVHEVVDVSTGERYETASEKKEPTAIRLVTTKRIVGKTEKRQLAENYAALLVDMEAATVGRLARMHDIPFYCLKAVSDGANEDLPDMNPYVSASGQLNTAGFVINAALRPRAWPALMRLGKNSKIAAEALAARVNEFVNEFRHADDYQRI